MSSKHVNIQKMLKGVHKAGRTGRHTPSTIGKHSKVRVNLWPKHKTEVSESEEIMPPKSKKYDNVPSRYMINRACNVSPSKISSKNTSNSSNKKTKVKDQYQNILIEQYGFDPVLPENINRLRELKKILCEGAPRVENSSQYSGQRGVSDGSQWHKLSARAPKVQNSSQYANPTWSRMELSDVSKWHHVDTVDDVDKYVSGNDIAGPFVFLKELKEDDGTNRNLTVQKEPTKETPKHIHISEVPRIKFIAEKFSRLRKNDIEVRKLNEKIVCVEYDVFDRNDVGDSAKPIQMLRAFFSIKPPGCDKTRNGKDTAAITEIPSFIKQKYEIADDDLKKLNDKEIEIIDEKIAENKPYLDDLKRILRRKQDASKKNKTALDLRYLYKMAQMESPQSDYDFSKLLTKDELDEVKDLILKRCASSVHGISRRCMKSKKGVADLDKEDPIAKSKSTIMDLMRDQSVKFKDSEEITPIKS